MCSSRGCMRIQADLLSDAWPALPGRCAAVALASHCVGRQVVVPVGVLAQASLSGPMGYVSGLGSKIQGLQVRFRRLLRTFGACGRSLTRAVWGLCASRQAELEKEVGAAAGWRPGGQ